MEENPMNEEQDYIDGFNLGYVMNKYSPEIGELISHAQGSGGRLDGMKAGLQQFDKENSKSRMPGWLKREGYEKPASQPEKSKDIEPER
jgi:hypothetical protein